MANKEKCFTEKEVDDILMDLINDYMEFQCNSIAVVASDIIRTLVIPKGKLEFRTRDMDDGSFGHIIRVILVDMDDKIGALDIGSIALPHMDEDMVDPVTNDIASKIDIRMKKIILGDGAKKVKTKIIVAEENKIKNKTYMN